MASSLRVFALLALLCPLTSATEPGCENDQTSLVQIDKTVKKGSKAGPADLKAQVAKEGDKAAKEEKEEEAAPMWKSDIEVFNQYTDEMKESMIDAMAAETEVVKAGQDDESEAYLNAWDKANEDYSKSIGVAE